MAISNDAGLRILVPLDDAMQSQRALTYAQALATATGGRLQLLRATDLDDGARFNSLASSASHLEEAGVAVEWSVVSGVDGQTAIREAEAAWQPDLIALATTRSSGLDRWLNGSVAEAVVKSARAPVLLVPRDWDRSLTAHGTVRILVALDGSTSAERAIDVILRLTSRLAAEYILMRAIHAERNRDGAEDYLRHVASRMESMLGERAVAWRVVVDSPATAILNSARELDVDAIAMSTRGHGAAHVLSIGSTAAEVVDQASVPMILVGPNALVTDEHTISSTRRPSTRFNFASRASKWNKCLTLSTTSSTRRRQHGPRMTSVWRASGRDWDRRSATLWLARGCSPTTVTSVAQTRSSSIVKVAT